MDALANPVRPDEVNVTVQPTDLLPVVIGDARHPYVDKTFFQPQFVHRTYADVLMPELRVGTEHSAISRSSVQTAIRERELTAIESGLDQDHNRARIHEVLDGSFGVLDPAFPAKWIKVRNDGIQGFADLVDDDVEHSVSPIMELNYQGLPACMILMSVVG